MADTLQWLIEAEHLRTENAKLQAEVARLRAENEIVNNSIRVLDRRMFSITQENAELRKLVEMLVEGIKLVLCWSDNLDQGIYHRIVVMREALQDVLTEVAKWKEERDDRRKDIQKDSEEDQSSGNS
jgi:phosphoenolpyruvate synthase/pyruvate phosphate dikinase